MRYRFTIAGLFAFWVGWFGGWWGVAALAVAVGVWLAWWLRRK